MHSPAESLLFHHSYYIDIITLMQLFFILPSFAHWIYNNMEVTQLWEPDSTMRIMYRKVSEEEAVKTVDNSYQDDNSQLDWVPAGVALVRSEIGIIKC